MKNNSLRRRSASGLVQSLRPSSTAVRASAEACRTGAGTAPTVGTQSSMPSSYETASHQSKLRSCKVEIDLLILQRAVGGALGPRCCRGAGPF